MTTGILAPMPEEIDLIIAHMSINQTINIADRVFHIGTIHQKPCVVALSKIGKVASALTAAIMIEQFKVDKIILTGVAGSVHDDLNIGDIIIANEVYQHDMDCSPIFPKLEIPLTGKSSFQCNAALIELATKSCNELLNHLTNYFEDKVIDKFNLKKTKVKKGIICSGDQFIGSIEQLQTIQKNIPNALAVEMECGAVGQVCDAYNVPFIVIRSISDNANHEAHIDFNEYINHVSKIYTKVIIEYMMSHS